MAKQVERKFGSGQELSAGMIWIGKALESIAIELPVHIESWTWQSDYGHGSERVFSLIVVGNRRKRAVKLFSKDEIDGCLTDKNLQHEIQLRLTKILTFLGPHH